MATYNVPNADVSSFKTGGRRHDFTYTWTIENLVFWAKKSDEYLETDVFRPRLIDDGIWRLRLYPRGRDETLLWYLERVYGERSETVYANFKITMSTGDVVHYEYHSNNYPFKKGSGAASATEKKLKDILSEGSLTKDPEPLTIVCQMSRRCSSMPLAEKLSSSTRIEVGRLTFSWHFEQFSKWDHRVVHSYPGYTYGNAVYDILSCKMHLYANRDPRDERLGIIIRFRRPPTEDFLIVARISVLDIHGRPAITYNETYFEKSGDDIIVWVTPTFIEKKKLTSEADLYLPNDELTLLSEFKIPVKNIYAVRSQYSLASSAALQTIEDTTLETMDVSYNSISTQTIQGITKRENGTQTETEPQMTEKEEQVLNDQDTTFFVLSRSRGHVVLEAIQKSSLSNHKMAKNLICCKEEDIEFHFDSDEFKDGGTSADDVIYYPEDGTIEFRPDSTLTDDSDNNQDFPEIAHSEDDNDRSSDDQTQNVETISLAKGTKIENVHQEKQGNFAKEQSSSTEDIYREDLITITEDEEDSEDVSSTDETCDSEDELTSEEDSDDSTDASTSEDDSSEDASTSEEDVSEYYDKASPILKRRTRYRHNSEESIASDLADYLEERGWVRTQPEPEGTYSKAFKACVAVYVLAMLFYFYINDAITYAKKKDISPSLATVDDADANFEFVKQLTLMYAETLDDPSTLDFVRGYTGGSNFPISKLSTENAWVVLALADAHQDEELVKKVMDFLDANKADTLESLAWRNEVGRKILKAHGIFRQNFAAKPPIQQSEVEVKEQKRSLHTR